MMEKIDQIQDVVNSIRNEMALNSNYIILLQEILRLLLDIAELYLGNSSFSYISISLKFVVSHAANLLSLLKNYNV